MATGEDIEGLQELLKRMRRLKALKPVTAALKLTGAHVMGSLQKYPRRNYVMRQRFKTDKQRRFFFYALRKGLIEVPYRRGQSPGSKNLKQQWRLTKENPLRVVVENQTLYGHWVQSAKHQTLFHRASGWPTDAEAARNARPVLQREIKRAINGILSGDDTED